MIDVSTAVKNKFKSDEFKGNFTLTIGEHTYTPSNILSNSTRLTESLCSGKNIDFSAVEKSELKISLINITENVSDLKGATLTLTQNVLNTTIPYGVFIIDDATFDGDYLYEITAYDMLHKFDADISLWWNEDVVFPITVRDLLISLCTKVGVSYNFPATFTNSTFEVTQNIFVEGATGIDFLRYIQEVCACFIKPTRTGVIELKELPTGTWSSLTPAINYTVPITKGNLEIADYTVLAIDKLQVRGNSDDIGIIVGIGENAYIIEANPLLYSISDTTVVDNIFAKLQNFIYVPFSASVKALPYIEVGDVVQIESFEEKTAYGVLLSRTMSGFLLNSDDIDVQGTEYREERVQSLNKTTTILNQKLHEVVNTVEEFSSTISNVTTEIIPNEIETALAEYTTTTLATAIEQSAETIQLSVINAVNGEQLNMHFLFDNQGVHIATLDGDGNIVSDYQSLFTEQGLRVMSKDGVVTLLAEQDTVDTSNLTAHTYLRVTDDAQSTTSRFQGFYNSIHQIAQQGIFWEK